MTSVVTDPKGNRTLNLYDLLGRQTRTVSGWNGSTNALSINVSGSVFAGASLNQTTDTAYDCDDHVVLLTAWNKSGTNAATFQKTQSVGSAGTPADHSSTGGGAASSSSSACAVPASSARAVQSPHG